MLFSVIQSFAGIFWCTLLTGRPAISHTLADAYEEPYILLGNRNSIYQFSLDGNEGVVVLNDTDSDISGIDFDARDGYMFWTDVATKTITRSHLNGSDLTVLISSGLRAPDGLAWDWVTKKVYWTDSGRRRIEVYDPERDIRKLIISTGSKSLPRDIAVDPATGWLFWSDLGDNPKIGRISMDSTNCSTIISTDIVWPSSLAIDYKTLTLFWSDVYLDLLESSNFDGTNRTTLEDTFIFYPFGIAFFNQSLIWGDWVVGFAFKLRVADPDDVAIITALLEMEPTGIKVVSESGQPEVTTPCRVANGNCSHLCLISATSPKGYSCDCPRHLRLASNHRDCRGKNSGAAVPSTHGSCVAANHTDCCTEGDCQGLPSVCLCSAECYSLGTCCPDIDTVCPASAPSQEYLLVANQGGILRLELNGDSQDVLVKGETHTTAVDFDISSDFMYWTDVVLGRIRRSFLNGSEVTTLLNRGIETPDGIAVDWINKKIYWTDASLKSIEVFDLIQSHRKQLIFTGEKTIPRSIVVDPSTRWLYWSDWGKKAVIERASMDGQGRQSVVSSGLVWPNGLTIDIESQILCWADAKLDKIESSNVDGTNRRVLTTLGIFHPFSLTLLHSQLYWSEWDMDVILTGSSGLYSTARHLAHVVGPRPMGIQAVSTTKQPLVPNPCLINATCSHLCLLSAISVDGYTCVCPDGWERMECISAQITDGDMYARRTRTVSEPKSSSSIVPVDSAADFKLDVLPTALAAVILVLFIIVIAMLILIIVKLGTTKKEKKMSLLKRQQLAIPNDYVTVTNSESVTSEAR